MLRSLTLLLMFYLLLPLSAWGAVTPWVKNEYAATRLVVGSYEGKQVTGGIHFRLKPGWKIYWRTPGDAGIPPALDWKGSQNLTDAALQFPFPERHTESFEGRTSESYVYTEEVVLPIRFSVTDPTKPLSLSAYLTFSACNKICIPFDAQFSLAVAPGSEDLASGALVEEYLPRIPQTDENILPATIHLEHSPPVLVVALSSVVEITDIFVEGVSGLRFGSPVITDGAAQIPINILHPAFSLDLLPGKTLRLTLVQEEGRAVERQVTVEAMPAPAAAAVAPLVLLAMLGSAFLGGLILNIMPCVLPVLSLKLLSVLKHSGKEQALIRKGFRVTALGMIATFLGLAVITLLLKEAGREVGWGFHFQEPAFLIGVTLLIVLFAYNLMGVFEFRLPERISTGAATIRVPGSLGHFLTGAFATILATPCVAPFVGAAVSFALSRGAFEILAIFTMMGVGMAFPYLLFSCFPQWAARLPKPGAWMMKVKWVFGILLLGTAMWLLWVLSNELTVKSALLLFMLCLLLKFWLQQRRPYLRYPGIAVTLVMAFALPLHMPDREIDQVEQVISVWKSFEPERIPELVAAGHVVFVDVTAEWCLLCQVNKVTVLDRTDVLRYLSAHNVIAMRADFTNRSPVISAFLKDNNRYGIPFNIVYGPAAPKGIPFGEILTKEKVIRAIRSAEGPL